MPIPIAAAVVAGLWTAGRWAAIRGLPYIARGIGSLFSRKITVGGAVALGATPTVLSVVDGLTDHTLSETLIDTPVGPALEMLLSAYEFSSDQQAAVISNIITNEVTERQLINENELDYERSRQLIDALGHATIGDITGAATAASDLGVNPSDILSAYNTAKMNNPYATIGEVGAATFNDIKDTLRQRDRQATVNTPSIEDYENFDLNRLSSQSLSYVFEEAANNSGLIGMAFKAVSFLAGLFGKHAKAFVQRWELDQMETEVRLTALRQAAQNGQLVSQFGNRFDLGHAEPTTSVEQKSAAPSAPAHRTN